jgi:hypothetical protein
MILACLVAAALTSGCLHRSERYDYADIEKSLGDWGGVRVRLLPRSSTYNDGVSVMSGPYAMLAVVWLKGGATLPSACRTHFQTAALHDAEGKVVASLAPQAVTPEVFLVGPPARPNPEGLAHASLPMQSFEIPHADYLAVIDFRLEGCGAIDGAYKVREIIKTKSRTHYFHPVWAAMMSV